MVGRGEHFCWVPGPSFQGLESQQHSVKGGTGGGGHSHHTAMLEMVMTPGPGSAKRQVVMLLVMIF